MSTTISPATITKILEIEKSIVTSIYNPKAIKQLCVLILGESQQVKDLLVQSNNSVVSSFTQHCLAGSIPWFDRNTMCFRTGDAIYSKNSFSHSGNVASRQEWKANQAKRSDGVQSNMLYGMEWETYIDCSEVSKSYTLNEFFSALPPGIACHKSDSSIRPNGRGEGVEFNFVPLPLARLKQIFSTLYAPENKGLMDRIQANESCGIHVHMGIPVVPLHRWHRYLHFVHSNRDMLHKLVGRKLNNSYSIASSNCTKPITQLRKEFMCNFKTQHRVGGLSNSTFLLTTNHYDCANMTSKGTVETRIFPSTTDKDKLLAYLELMDAMFTFVISSSLQELTYQGFLIWLTDYDNSRLKAKDRQPTYLSHNPQYKELIALVLGHRESVALLPKVPWLHDKPAKLARRKVE